MVKCVPKKYTTEVDYLDPVWNSNGFKKNTYDSEKNLLSTKTLNTISIWPIGINNVDEENLNIKRKKPFNPAWL